MHRLCVIVFAVPLLIGCGGEPREPNYSEVTGTITLEGQPIVGASVTFIPKGTNTGNRAFGTTDDAGKYKLKGPRNSTGASPGEYSVVVNLVLGPGGKPLPPDAPKAASGGTESLPPQYSDPGRTSLQATVGKDGGNFDFPLKKK